MTYSKSETDVAKYMHSNILRTKYFKEHFMTGWQAPPYPYDHNLGMDEWNALRDKVEALV
ncbi:hypothetical protein [Pseudomonas phage vB_PaeP_TUMS_P10]|nr:hypothetical protein [Pseudomonas phage vB_PaeS_TUMS_P6]UNI71952.1 hypothetical protein [Pseudomonas phage vB_PaeP_TUMS_P10]